MEIEKMHIVETIWKENQEFDSTFDSHHVTIDNTISGGGNEKGSPPKPLMLMALTGCIGMNLVPVLNKMRIPFQALRLTAKAELNEGIPKVYTKVLVEVFISAGQSDYERILNALKMTEEKYCGVSQMFRQFCELTLRLTIQ